MQPVRARDKSQNGFSRSLKTCTFLYLSQAVVGIPESTVSPLRTTVSRTPPPLPPS